MPLLSEYGHHIELTQIDENQNEKTLFPVNTVEDVYVDENGNSLVDFLPKIVDNLSNPTEESPLTATESATGELTDAVMTALLS